MQPVNDDIDDIFRKAGEDYPLDTSGSDWSKVSEGLQAESNAATVKKRSKWEYLLLLLLLPMFFICNRYGNNALIDTNDKPSAEAEVKTEKANNIDQTSTAKENEIDKRDGGLTIAAEGGVKKNEPGKKTETEDDNEVPFRLSNHSIAKPETVRWKTKLLSTEKDNLISYQANTKEAQTEPTDTKTIALNTNSTNDNSAATTNALSDVTDIAPTTNNSNTHVTNNQVQPTDTSKQIQKLNPPITTAAPDSSKTNEKAKTTKAKTKRKVYAGIIAGPDFSFVKEGAVKGTGYSIGIVAGYQFSKKLSIESGLLWDHKRYAADGGHINTEKFNWAVHTNLLWLDGYCNMFEVPLSVRYTIASSAKLKWFVSGGATSYIMKKEDYDYTAERYGQKYYGNRSYNNSATNLFSLLQFSAGVERPLGSIGNLRIEPYFKAPLKGVGITQMPLRSAGLYVGITRNLR